MTWRAGFFAGGLLSALAPLWLVSAQAPSPAPVTQSPHGDLAGECTTCHTPETWTPVRSPLPFDHRGTGFALVAAHGQAGCRDCHRSLVFSHVGTACADCHRDAHRGELGSGCEGCHVPESWTNRRELFRVHSRTRFPLLAVHAGLECEACHAGRQPREFAGTPTDCVACHLRDFQAARDPDHARLGFPRRCEDCHSAASRAWQGGTFSGSFPHPAGFPLRGAHTALACSACHASGFTRTPRQCVACHREAAWQPATFDHGRFFPIDSGRHAGIACRTCHTTPGNFGLFSCANSCHPRGEMDEEHDDDDVRGYQYESRACLSCHPRGVE
jgi:hypothetical protein